MPTLSIRGRTSAQGSTAPPSRTESCAAGARCWPSDHRASPPETFVRLWTVVGVEGPNRPAVVATPLCRGGRGMMRVLRTDRQVGVPAQCLPDRTVGVELRYGGDRYPRRPSVVRRLRGSGLCQKRRASIARGHDGGGVEEARPVARPVGHVPAEQLLTVPRNTTFLQVDQYVRRRPRHPRGVRFQACRQNRLLGVREDLPDVGE